MPFHGRFISPPIRLKLGPNGLNFPRADIRVHGIDQSGRSFEGRVFLNNPNATLQTATTPENGYAGSFHVYGYGVWPDDIARDPADLPAESDEIRAPIEKDLIATEAVRRAAAQGSDVTVTVIPVYPGDPPADAAEALKLEGVSIEIAPA
jgi:hypothetical protein